MFNLQDLQNLQIFMQRVQLQGNESMAHAELVIKIGNHIQAIQQAQNQPETPPAEPPEEPPEKTRGKDA